MNISTTDSGLTLTYDYAGINSFLAQMKPKNYAIGRNPLKLVVTDVDGTLTNGQVIYDRNGNRSRWFSVIDGYGFEMLKRNGFDVLMISGENDYCIEKRAEKVNSDCALGVKNKREYVDKWYPQYKEIYVLGDDVNDLDLMDSERVVLAATPKGSVIERLQKDFIHVLGSKGGEGAFREFAEMILLSNRIEPY